MHRRVIGSALAALVAGCLGLVGASAAGAAVGNRHPMVYVTDSHGGVGTLTPIDTVTGKVGTPIVVGGFPVAVAINPTATMAWVVRRPTTGRGSVVPVKLASRKVLAPIPVGNSPVAIAITPNGTTAYVANRDDNTVTPINLGSRSAKEPIPAGPSPDAIAIAPNGKTAWVADQDDNCIDNSCDGFLTPIKVATGKPGRAIDIGPNGSPDAISVTPNGTTVYLASDGFFNAAFQQGAIVVNVTTRRVSDVVTGETPDAVAVTPDGTTALVANAIGNSVTPISVATNQAGTAIPVGVEPAAVAVAPAATTAYVANANANASPPAGSVTPIALTTDTPGTAIPVGDQPNGAAMTPDQAPVARFSAQPGGAGTATLFNASASTARFGTIKSYAWSFGDGQVVSTSSPTVSHTYTKGGSYTVQLKVTDSAGTSTKVVFTGQTVSRNGGPSAEVTQQVAVPGTG